MIAWGGFGLKKSKTAKQKQRVIQEAGYLKRGQMPRNESGQPLCRWCGAEVPRPRRTFCSDACVHQHRLRSDVDYLRATVFSRDAGVCSRCGTDTVALGLEVRDMASGSIEGQQQALIHLTKLGYSTWRAQKAIAEKMSLWDTDHIKPVLEGGGGCDLNLIQTLCVPCHAKETKQLRRRRALGIAWDQPTLFDYAKEQSSEREESRSQESQSETHGADHGIGGAGKTEFHPEQNDLGSS